MNLDKIKSIILELSSEDAYGSWELWGYVLQDVPALDKEKLKKQFISIIDKIIK